MTEAVAEIRTATANDAAALSCFAAAVFPLGGRPAAHPSDLARYIAAELTAERFATMIQDRNSEILLAENANGLCGYSLVVEPSPHPQIEATAPAELRKFYIAPAYHGAGVADTLMQKLIANLESRRQDVAWLSVFSENPRAVAFYLRWGFHVVGTQDFLVGADRQMDFVMRRDLQPGRGSR
jgi:ribosomal protein S18 acetylase RimI-like enzyme